MSQAVYPFNPVAGGNVAYVTGASAALTNLKAGCRNVRVVNTHATEICYVRFGAGSATAADTPIRPASSEIFSKDEDEIVGAIYSAGAGSAQVQCGNGS